MADLTKPTQKYYRAISGEGFTPVHASGNVGPAIRMQWISIERLFVDSRYQRPLNKGDKSNARQIARNFRWRRFAPVIVTPIPGTNCFSIIDGQYKATGVALRGLALVPCAIVDAPTVEDQADSFKFLNANVTRIMQFDIYRAALASGDEISKMMESLAAKCGIRLVASSTKSKDVLPGDCTTFKSFNSAAHKYKESVFIAAMRALSSNASSHRLINSTMILAFCQIFKTNPGWVDNPQVMLILKHANLRVMITRAVEASFKDGTPKKVTIIALLHEHVTNRLSPAPVEPTP